MPPLRLLLCVLVAAIASIGCATPTAFAPSGSPLLIVGDVTATTARVLIDVASTIATATVFIRSTTVLPKTPTPVYTVDQEIQLDFSSPLDDDTDRPRVFVLDRLVPAQHYVVTFQFPTEATVRFRTSNDHAANSFQHTSTPARVLVVSCDRFVDDGDDALWKEIESDLDAHDDAYFGVAHIGDQVYVDAGDARVPVLPIRDEIAASPGKLRDHYDMVAQQFRAIYRATLGRAAAQHVLRRGAHWMLPDDHEIINNINSHAVDRVFGDGSPVLGDAERRGLQLHYRAGLQVLYEYQYQLRRDVAWDQVDFLVDPLDTVLSLYPLYFAVDVDRLKLFFLDVRFDRSFTLQAPAQRRLLVSPTQRDELSRQLAHWTSDASINDPSIVVLASMPLFFHSQFTANIVYAVEKELYPGHPEHASGLKDLYDLLQSFVQSPSPALKLLVGGDVHMLAHTQVCGSSTAKCIDQLITSGLTSGSTAIHDAKLVPFYLLILRLYPLCDWLLSSIGMAPAPWTISADRVFLGRNYGVLEIDSRGQFEWRNSVVLDHDHQSNRLTQAAFDLLRPPVILVFLVVSLFIIFKGKRQHTPVKHEKTE